MEQHMHALQLANTVRLARVALKRDIKAGEVMAGEVLLGDVPSWLEGMLVEEFCHAILRFQHRHFQRLAAATPFGLTAVVGALTARQRRVLGEALAEWECAAELRRARPRRFINRKRAAVA